MKLVAPKGAIWRICARAFNPTVYSPIRFVFAVCLELVLFYVFIVYFWGFLRIDHIVLCSIQGEALNHSQQYLRKIK